MALECTAEQKCSSPIQSDWFFLGTNDSSIRPFGEHVAHQRLSAGCMRVWAQTLISTDATEI